MSANLEMELDDGFGGKVSITCSSVENNNDGLNNTDNYASATNRSSDVTCAVQRGTTGNSRYTPSSDNNCSTHPSNLDELPVVEHGTHTTNRGLSDSSNVVVTPSGDVTRPGTSHAPLIPMLVNEKLYYIQSPNVEKTISQIKCPKGLANATPISGKTDTNSLGTGQQSSVEVVDGNICDTTIIKKSSGVNESVMSVGDSANIPLNEAISADEESLEDIGTEIVEVIEYEDQTLDKMPPGNESTDEIKTISDCAKHNEDPSTSPVVTKTKLAENHEDQSKEATVYQFKEHDTNQNKAKMTSESGLKRKRKSKKPKKSHRKNPIVNETSLEEKRREKEIMKDDSIEEEIYECACYKVFMDIAKYKKHKLKCKKVESDFELSESEEPSDFESTFCALCDQTFDDPEDLKKHKLICHPVIPANATEENDEGGENVEPDDKKVERTITIGWVSSKGKIIQDQGVILRKPTTCGECGHYFRGRTAYALHKLNHENVKAGISYECQHCQERFSVEADLQVHENIAHCANHIPFKCHHCDEKFPTRVANDSHMLYTHDEDGGRFPFRCHECSSVFTKREVFVKHMATYTNEKLAKNITCKQCKKKFVLQKDLTEHMWKSHEKHPCETCGKQFTKPRLHIHMRTHAEVKAFECPVCKKRFAQGTNRAKHMRVHTGKKPYECDICQKTFNHKVSLKMHQKKMHSIDWWADNGVDKSKETSKGKANRKPICK